MCGEIQHGGYCPVSTSDDRRLWHMFIHMRIRYITLLSRRICQHSTSYKCLQTDRRPPTPGQPTRVLLEEDTVVREWERKIRSSVLTVPSNGREGFSTHNKEIVQGMLSVQYIKTSTGCARSRCCSGACVVCVDGCRSCPVTVA